MLDPPATLRHVHCPVRAQTWRHRSSGRRRRSASCPLCGRLRGRRTRLWGRCTRSWRRRGTSSRRRGSSCRVRAGLERPVAPAGAPAGAVANGFVPRVQKQLHPPQTKQRPANRVVDEHAACGRPNTRPPLLRLAPADAARDPWVGSPQQRQALQQQVAELQARLVAKEGSSRKYKDAVRAVKVGAASGKLRSGGAISAWLAAQG